MEYGYGRVKNKIFDKILLYAHTYSKIYYSFLLNGVFFNADSKSQIRIFRTALVFDLWEEKERKNCHNKFDANI